MTSDSLRNHTDDWFIEELDKHISKEAVSTLIQDYIKKLVQHEVDVITDSDWFSSQVDSALIALNLDKEDSTND